MARLTDEQLDDVIERVSDGICPQCGNRRERVTCPQCNGTGAFTLATGAMESILAELRQRRAADLTAEEREALEFAKDVMTAGTKWERAMHDPVVRGHVEKCRRSIAALSKLLAAGGGE